MNQNTDLSQKRDTIGLIFETGVHLKELIEENPRGEILEDACGIEFMAANRTILAGNPIRSQDLRKQD